MRILKHFVAYLVLGVSSVSNAGIIDELAALEAHKFNQSNDNKTTIKNTTPIPSEKRYITLSNGKRMDISDWQIVHFMSSTCSYCRQFNPVLKQISDSTKIPVFVYSFDGNGDSDFPEAFPTNKEVVDTFFAELPQATPTDFLVNINTMVTLPLTQGATSYHAFLQRLDEVFIYVNENFNNLK